MTKKKNRISSPPDRPLRIAIAASEAAPFAKTGGLGDVAGALPKALSELGCEVKVFIPKYAQIDDSKYQLHYSAEIGEMPIRVAGIVRTVHIQQAKIPGSEVDIYFVDCPHFYYRKHIYTSDRDEDERYILFCKAVIESLQRLRWAPDVVHCNDWQTGLLPLYLKDNYNWDRMFDGTACVMTIHNMAYQGRFPRSTVQKAELRENQFHPGGPIEFHGSVSFMKIGITYSEMISSVSPTYSREILTPEYGHSMEEVLLPRREDLVGILNGADYEHWNPDKDPMVPYHYTAETLDEKQKNKEHLINQTSLPFMPGKPLIGMVSRLVAQKGLEYMKAVAAELMLLDAQWIILGSGEDQYEELFQRIAAAVPQKMWAYIGFNNELAHLIEAGADMFLMPSAYEPCGLNQIYSLKYGTVPIVRKTGGLADTVWDWHELQAAGMETGTGFTFLEPSGYSLFTTVRRAIDVFDRKDEWRKIQLNGMRMDYSWEKSALSYIDLYKTAVLKKRGSI